MNRRILALAGALALAAPLLLVSPASAQVAGSLSAEGECAPDGSTQGIVITFINSAGIGVDITFADAEGTIFGDEDLHDLTFSPTTVADGATATADISVPGANSGTLSVEVSLDVDGGSALVTDDFEIQACVAPVTTTTTKAPADPAPAVAAQPAFTG
jgi:hypothetical protein